VANYCDQALPFSIFHKARREAQKYQMESEVSKILVDLSTLMFMKLHTAICWQFVAEDYLLRWLLGISKVTWLKNQ